MSCSPSPSGEGAGGSGRRSIATLSLYPDGPTPTPPLKGRGYD